MSGRKSHLQNVYVCLNCGADVYDHVERKYCGKSCAAIMNGKLFPKRTKKEKLCLICGTSFLPYRADVHNCPNCRFKKVQKTLGTTKIQSTEQNIRGHARRVMAKTPRVCAVCAYSIYVEVCHVKAIKDFPSDALLTEINALSNLVFLCPNHHKEYDLGILELGTDSQIRTGDCLYPKQEG